MKTLGQILQETRELRHLTVNGVAKGTKIEPKYIKALENNDYDKLPSPTFTKGFIRNYAQALEKNPEDLIAIYRRDFGHYQKKSPLLTPTDLSIRKKILEFSKTNILFILLGLVVFLGYLGFQYRALLTPTPLEIVQPSENAVLTSPVTVEGQTTSDAIITINTDTTLKPEGTGVFFTELNFSPGQHQIEVQSTNRFGRTSTKTVTFTVISQ